MYSNHLAFTLLQSDDGERETPQAKLPDSWAKESNILNVGHEASCLITASINQSGMLHIVIS
jgi:hypothetical protein